jgi:predicted ferric reductase
MSTATASIARRSFRQIRLAEMLVAAVLILPLFWYIPTKSLNLTTFGAYLGTIGLLAVIASLMLMLRFAWLTHQAGGLENMYRLHRAFGMAAYVILLIHPLVLAHDLGWQALSPAGKSWGFIAGWLALLLLMLPLLFTFVLRPRGYAKWRNLHWLTALSYLGMLGHVVFYQREWPLPVALVVDGLLLFGTLAPVIRYFVIDRGLVASSFRVAEVNRPIPGVIEVRLAPQGSPLDIKPGQFVFVRFMPGDNYTGCAHFHPFTASGVYNDGSLRLSIKANGKCTEMMQGLEPDARARVQGPFGHLFENVRQNVSIWIAGGIGITPFLARAQMLDPNAGKVKLFYIVSEETGTAYLDELRAVAQSNSNFQLYPIVTHGVREVTVSVFDAMLPPWDDKSYVMCGPPGMIEFVRGYLTQHGVTPDHIHEEKFDFR